MVILGDALHCFFLQQKSQKVVSALGRDVLSLWAFGLGNGSQNANLSFKCVRTGLPLLLESDWWDGDEVKTPSISGSALQSF